MTTHLSVRLAWHDRGWDGRVCDAPDLNAHCIVHRHIRDSRDDHRERQWAGTPLADLDGWLPPCSRDPTAYADRGFMIVHQDRPFSPGFRFRSRYRGATGIGFREPRSETRSVAGSDGHLAPSHGQSASNHGQPRVA